MAKPYFNSAELRKMGFSQPTVEMLRYVFEHSGNGVAILTVTDIENLMFAIYERNSEFDRLRREIDELRLQLSAISKPNTDPILKRVEALESVASWG